MAVEEIACIATTASSLSSRPGCMRECGRFASGRRHMRGLVTKCEGKPEHNTTYEAYVRYLKGGRHPTSGVRLDPLATRVQGNCAGALGVAADDSVQPLRKAQRVR